MKYGRLTAREAASKGYLPAKVFVNGVDTPNVTDFDDNEGWADVWVLKNGQPYVEECAYGDRVVTERIYGNIEYFPNQE